MTPPEPHKDQYQRYLTEADIDYIAEKAAERALEKVYGQIGKSMVTKILWFLGAVALGVAAAKGWLVGPGSK
jgi:hypothetical protein